MKTALYTIISFGLGLAILIGIGLLAARRRSLRTIIMAMLFFCMAFSMLPSILHIRESTHSYPALAVLGSLAAWCIGPLLYAYFRLLFEPAWRPAAINLTHFLSMPLAALGMYMWPEWRARFESPLPHWLEFHLFGLLVLPHIQIYLAMALLRVYKYSTRDKSVSRPALRRWVFILIGLYMFGTMLGAAGMLLNRHHELAHMAIGFLALVVALQYVLMQRHPDFIAGREVKEEKGRYERSRLRGLDSADLRGRLDKLMAEDKLYLDEELTLQTLAGDLKVTPHQLSEFLNDNLGRNFYAFINEHRVEEAMRLLREEPERTVLSIGYAVGFNSKSSFHSAFTKQAGQTPGEYRKQSKADAAKDSR